MKDFDEILSQMGKPEVPELKHADLLAKAISNAQDKSVVSLWWLLIPLYVVAALVMKGMYMPQSTFKDNLHALADKDGYTALLLFLILPVLVIIINCLSIRKLYFLSGNPRPVSFLTIIRINILFIIISLALLIFYFI